MLRAPALLIVLLAASALAEPAACTSRPNVLVIELTGVRADATSLHPEPRNETPVLRELAARGVNFARTYSTSDFSNVGHFSLLTGFKTGHHSPFDRREASLPHQFARHGYRTFVVASNPNLVPEKERSIAGFADQTLLGREWQSLDPDALEAATRLADQRLQRYGAATTDFARMMAFSSPAAALERLIPRLGGEQPFFGLVTFEATDPWLPDPATYTQHEPVRVPDLRGRKVSDELQFPYGIEDDARREFVLATIARAWDREWATTLDLSPEQIAVYRNRYHAVVRDLDRAVGRIIAELEARQLLSSTIVVIASPMGLAFGESNLITAGFNTFDQFEVFRRVPLLMLLPPCHGASPLQVDESVSLADVAPTLYELAGIEAGTLWRGTRRAHGRSLARLLPGLRPARVPQLQAFAPPLTPFGLLDDSPITLRGPEDVRAKRSALVHYIWGSSGFPNDVLPSTTLEGIESPVAGLTGVRRVDELRIALPADIVTPAYHFIPAKPNGRLVVVHQGHGCAGLAEARSGLPGLITALVADGYGVLGLEMPKQRPGDCAPLHEPLFTTTYGDATAYRLFLEPVAVALNYLERNAARDDFPRYRQFHMIGFSGGGWTTTVYAALDPRIRVSISVAGSMPLYLRAGGSTGDIEQYDPVFYSLAGYPELYVMATVEKSRRQIQLLNRRDSCCFGELQHETGHYDTDIRTFEQNVRSALKGLGAPAGAFSVRIDEAAERHTVSESAIREVILPALRAQ